MRFLRALLFCRDGHVALPWGMVRGNDVCARCGSYLYGGWK